jgi:predicted hotdog family 3-hydroxylacyl-ACP dehydratase
MEKPLHAIVSGNEITDYIPQRNPIVMVDKFFGIEEMVSYSGLTVRPENIFVENGRLNEPGIIEHIAQSCALRIGYLCKQQNLPAPVGYIAAIKNMCFMTAPVTGDELITTVKILQEVLEVTLVAAEVYRGKDLVATCEMKIFSNGNS